MCLDVYLCNNYVCKGVPRSYYLVSRYCEVSSFHVLTKPSDLGLVENERMSRYEPLRYLTPTQIIKYYTHDHTFTAEQRLS